MDVEREVLVLRNETRNQRDPKPSTVQQCTVLVADAVTHRLRVH